MSHRPLHLAAALLVMAWPGVATAQGAPPDSVRVQIQTVLRAFYLHLENHNWDALSPYVLSPKLLERRGGPGGDPAGNRDRARGSGASHAASLPKACPAKPPALIDEADIRIDGDWAEVSVPRCSGAAAGIDELRMLYFEKRWRFIYTDLFDGAPGGQR